MTKEDPSSSSLSKVGEAAVIVAVKAVQTAVATFNQAEYATQAAAMVENRTAPWMAFLSDEEARLVDAVIEAGLVDRIEVPPLKSAAFPKRGVEMRPGCGGDNWDHQSERP